MTTTFAGIDLARQLERAEALSNARFVEARARVQPESKAEWIIAGGAYAMFDLPHSPCTQTFCMGLFEEANEQHFDQLETFFKHRGAPVMHEICPLASKSTWSLLIERGYAPVEFSNMMFRDLTAQPAEPSDPAVTVRLVEPKDHATWVDVSRRGWVELEEFASMMSDLMQVALAREDSALFLAEISGEPAASAAMTIQNGVALMAGAATVPEARRRGAQRALFDARLRHAAELGCTRAAVVTEPGSASQHNAQRQGFSIAYTRTKWALVR